MNPYLSKAVEITKWLATRLIEIGRWVYAWMRSVEIDQPRGVTLCLAFQLVVLLVLMLGLTPTPVSVGPPSDQLRGPRTIEDAKPREESAAGSAVESPAQ